MPAKNTFWGLVESLIVVNALTGGCQHVVMVSRTTNRDTTGCYHMQKTRYIEVQQAKDKVLHARLTPSAAASSRITGRGALRVRTHLGYEVCGRVEVWASCTPPSVHSQTLSATACKRHGTSIYIVVQRGTLRYNEA